jgi:flagellar basal body-associated protein FliL
MDYKKEEREIKVILLIAVITIAAVGIFAVLFIAKHLSL